MHYRQTILWQKAMLAVDEIYRLASLLPREETYGMRSQLTRAAVSIPSNIAEGWTRETQKDKAHFLAIAEGWTRETQKDEAHFRAIAQGSLAETETLLMICERQGWFEGPRTNRASDLLDQVSRMLTTMRRNRRASRS